MANQVEKLNTIALADIEKVDTLTDAQIEKINTLEFLADVAGQQVFTSSGTFTVPAGEQAYLLFVLVVVAVVAAHLLLEVAVVEN